jgi:hypothetical protein
MSIKMSCYVPPHRRKPETLTQNKPQLSTPKSLNTRFDTIKPILPGSVSIKPEQKHTALTHIPAVEYKGKILSDSFHLRRYINHRKSDWLDETHVHLDTSWGKIRTVRVVHTGDEKIGVPTIPREIFHVARMSLAQLRDADFIDQFYDLVKKNYDTNHEDPKSLKPGIQLASYLKHMLQQEKFSSKCSSFTVVFEVYDRDVVVGLPGGKFSADTEQSQCIEFTAQRELEEETGITAPFNAFSRTNAQWFYDATFCVIYIMI